MKLKTEHLTNCPICGAAHLQSLMEIPDFESNTGVYGLVECKDCGLAFTSPRPLESEIPALYAERTTADFPDTRATLVRRLRDFAINAYLRRELGPLQDLHDAPFSVLDFGCGDGALALGIGRHARASKARVKVTAVDFHSAVPTALASANPNELRYMSFQDWQGVGEKYDAVFMRHVLEHHPAPLRLLRELRQVLKKGGRLLIEVPNRRSVWAGIFGPYYAGYYIPRHLMHFDRNCLRLAIETSGMRCLSLRLGHTPLLGRSIAYRLNWNIGNLGLLGLASYPFQIVIDLIAGSSSTLSIVAKLND